MFLAIAAAIAASTATLPTCSWDRPGRNPFMGNVVNAVDRYTDIPELVRARLKERMSARQYDEIAAIRRNSIIGPQHRYSELRDMHFGQGRLCRTVSRKKWSAQTVERGLVYCESGHCIIVPTVCRNVSRVNRLPDNKGADASGPVGDRKVAGGSGEGGGGGVPDVAFPAKPTEAAKGLAGSGPITYESPAAGTGSGLAGGTGGAPSFSDQLAPTATAGDTAYGAPVTGGGDGTPAGGIRPSGTAPVEGSTSGSTPGSDSGGYGNAADGTVGGIPALSGGPSVPFVGLPLLVLPALDTPTAPVPEPGTWMLLGAGLGLVVWLARRRRSVV